MAGGLLDYFMGDTGGASTIDPRMMGLLGMAGGVSQAFAPQPASRLPLARPNMAYLLGQAAGGYGQGFGAGLSQQQLAAQTQGQLAQNYGTGLQNFMNTQNYNLTAPYFGQPQLPVAGMPNSPPISSGMPTPSPAPAPMPQPSPAQMGALPVGPGSMPSVTSPSAVSASPVPPAPMPSPPIPGASPPDLGTPTGSAAPNLMDLYKNVPPPILQMRGMQVPPELTAAYFAGVPVGTPAWNNVANAALLKTAGIKPMIGGERPGVLPQYYNMQTGKYEADTSQLPQMAAAAQASAGGTAAGQYPYKVAEAWQTQRARVDAEHQIAANQYQLKTGEPPPDGMPKPSMGGPAEPIASPRGTQVPAPITQVMGPGEQQITKQLENSAKTEENWNNVRPSLEQTENRLLTLGTAFKQVKTGGLTETRSTIANNVRGAGFPALADQIMTAKDTTAVQQALWNGMQDVLGTLKVINTGTGGRILNSEFNAFMEHGFSPNMQPEALHGAIAQQLGSLYQTRNMIDDFYSIGKPGGWRDANQFQSAYLSQKGNDLSGQVEKGRKALGDFKGMSPPQFSSPMSAEFKALPSGAHFLDDKGVERIKP